MILSTFTDDRGREWHVAFTPAVIVQMDEELSGLLGCAASDALDGGGLPDLLEVLDAAPDIAAVMAWVLLRPQATVYGCTFSGLAEVMADHRTRRRFASAVLAAATRPDPADGAGLADSLDRLFSALDRQGRLAD